MALPAPCVTIVDPARPHLASGGERPPVWRPSTPVVLGAFLVLLLTAGVAAATSQRAAHQVAEQAARRSVAGFEVSTEDHVQITASGSATTQRRRRAAGGRSMACMTRCTRL